MKRYFKGLYMSLGMFCAIPLPFQLWDDKYINLMLPCFPLIGGLIGALWWGLAEVLLWSRVHIVLVSAVLTVFPFLITGFLHLDGYMDTSDAILSRRPLEDKLRILKDPHTGAFAVIMIAILFVIQFAAVYVIVENEKHFMMLIVISIISRCASAVSILSLKAMPQSGYANMFKKDIKVAHKIFVFVITACSIIGSYFIAGIFGVIISAVTVFTYMGAMAYAYKEFKGVSGDLAGFASVISELCGLIAMAVI